MLRTAPAPRSRWLNLVARLLVVLILLTGTLALGGAAGAYGAYVQLTNSLTPRLDAITKHDSFQTTRIYDRHGTLLYEFFGTGKRTRVPIDQISPLLINAAIAIEDKTFFKNQGVDYEGIAKAVGRSLQAGEETGGASTITQQLVRGVVLTDEERTQENRYRRKLTEIVLAQELTRRYGKRDILELYLNEIYYGNLAYGIQAASEVYFGVGAKNLSLAQASLLAGLPQLPSVYDPINYLDGNVLKGVPLSSGWLRDDYQLPRDLPPPKERQIAVLTQMVEEGYATESEARAAAEADLHFANQEVPLNAPHFVFYIRKLLEERYGQQFANEGLSVYTTLDLNIQQMVQEQARERIAELEERNIHNAAVVVMQPNTGQILAMVGSIDYNKVVPSKNPREQGNVLDGQVNVAVRERQPGSALKPFTYLAAMERGMTPATVLWDVPTEFLGGGEPYKPLNYNGKWNGPVRIRTALANSLNMPAVKALKFAGVDYTLNLLDRVGVKGGLKRGTDVYGLSLTLGGGEVTPLELTTAYNTLASGGRYYAPEPFLKIVDGNGKAIYEYHQELGPQVLNADHVAIISDMLSDDNARKPVWGLNSKLKLSRPAAVKTGTSNDWRDAWAAGYTPYVTVGVWTGNNNNEATAKVESLTGGGVIWHNVMEALFATPAFEQVLAEPYGGQLPLEFNLPQTLNRRTMCALPGPFGGYKEDLFSPDMFRRTATITNTLLPQPTSAPSANDRPDKPLGCDSYTRVTVLRLPGETISVGDPVNPEATIKTPTRYCKPAAGVEVPRSMLATIFVWKTPARDPSERVQYSWPGGTASGNIPTCDQTAIARVAPPDGARMPDLRYFGENQAKERLAALGVTNYIYVDYQTRDRIPEIFDQFSPYAVVSTQPRAGESIKPGDTIVLGVRSPEAEPVVLPGEQPAQQQPAEQPAEQPPAQPAPADQAAPAPQP